MKRATLAQWFSTNSIFSCFIDIVHSLWPTSLRWTFGAAGDDEARQNFIQDADIDSYGTTTGKRLNLDKLRLVRTLDHKFKVKPTKRVRRLIIVGDVHGCKTELIALLEKVAFNADCDHLILAGDFTCKGPDSRNVIRICRSLDASCVRGNHEAKLLAAYASGEPAVGSLPTAAASLASRLPLSDLEWLAKWPAILNLGAIPGLPYKSVVVVHAGLACNTNLEEQDPFLVMNMRSMDPQTHQAFVDRKDGTPWSIVWNEVQKTLPKDQRTLVVYGHDSRAGLVERDYSVGLDSGCVKGGRLSAFVIEIGASATKTQIVSVKSRR